MRKILITGANSYIGTSFEKYINENFSETYFAETIDMIDGSWKEKSFADYDVVFHVAGIAHSDSNKIPPEKEKIYRSVNTDLTIETAKKAKTEGVKQFIFMSSVIVYGNSGKIGKSKKIDEKTLPKPANCYGDSKFQAELGILPLNSKDFKVCVLRPPMVYGKESRGNFRQLEKFGKKMCLFPYIKNERSMLYIGNLVEFVRLMIENEENGIFFPQNAEYSNTSEIVRMIGAANGKKVRLIKGFGWLFKFLSLFTGTVNKAFGNLTYDQSLSSYKTEYRKYSLEDSIKESEK